MKPTEKKEAGQEDLFRSRLDKIIDLKHGLVRLAGLIEWERLEEVFGQYYAAMGRPGLSIRIMIGLHLLKHIYGLSDEEVCARWVKNPYFQFFCGEIFFQHDFPIERSSLSYFRARIGEEALEKVLQESLNVAYMVGALNPKDLQKVVLDTTVQEKNIAHPTEHGPLRKAFAKVGVFKKVCQTSASIERN